MTPRQFQQGRDIIEKIEHKRAQLEGWERAEAPLVPLDIWRSGRMIEQTQEQFARDASDADTWAAYRRASKAKIEREIDILEAELARV